VPHWGDPTSSSFVSESWSGGFLHTPPCRLASSRLGFPLGLSKEAWNHLVQIWWRILAHVWSYEEALTLAGSHPLNGDPGSTQILTQHCGALSQIVRQLMSSRTTPTSKSLQFSPSALTNHLRTGSVWNLHHILTTWTEPWDFVKSSALYISVHMELSICLSFYLRCSLRGYTVGTTVEFLLKIVEALAPQSRRWILRKCP
jgi:hypothetical protein